MSENNIKQKAFKRGFGSPEARGALLVGGVIFIVLVACAVGAYFYLKSDTEVNVQTGKVDASSVKVKSDAVSTEHYKEAKRQENNEKYEAAKSAPGGVAIPFTFDEEPKGGEQGKDITNCGCTISDDQLISAIERLGLNKSTTTKVDNMRVAKSDIYISTTGQLMDDDGKPIKFRDLPLFMQSNGQLVDEKGISVLSKDKQPLYLGKNGEIIDQQTRSVPMHGDLITSTGQIILADGRIAIRAGNMQRIARTDIYLTKEGQLVTMDGKGIRHSGAYVYQNDERKLINKAGLDVAWEQQAVYQNNSGQLVNVGGSKFNQPGILFSYEGILIDNDGLLTKPLVDIEKIGDSDLYRTKSGILVDGYGLPILNYGAKVRIGPSQKLLTASGQAVLNRTNAEVYLSEDGALRVDVGRGGVHTGALKISDGVSLDRSGQLISRKGRLERRGTSDIYLTSDGFLSDKDGRSILFMSKDTFLDFSSIKNDGSQGLETFDGQKITDKSGRRIFITIDGRFVDENGNVIKEVGILTTSDGVLITSGGKKVVQDNSLERVVTKDGKPVTYQGKEVFKGSDGRLYDSEGNPVLSPEGNAVYMDHAGNLTDEFGKKVNDVELMAGERPVQNGELSTRKKLTTGSGERLFHNGQEVFVDSSGRVIDKNGASVTTKDGKEIFINKDGNLVDSSGNKIDEKILSTEDGKLVASGIVAGREQVVTKNGKSVKFNGKDVFKGNDGALYDETGTPIQTSDGKRVFIDSSGKLIDESGAAVTEELLKVSGDKFVKNGDLRTKKVLTDSSGNPIKYGNKDVFLDAEGRVVDGDGNPIKDAMGNTVYVDRDGNFIDKNGKPITQHGLQAVVSKKLENAGGIDALKSLNVNGSPVVASNGSNTFTDSSGKVVDSNGKPILSKDGREMFVNKEGKIVDSNGKLIDENNLSVEQKRSLRAGELSTKKQLLDRNGMPILHNGKEVFIAKDGRLVDQSGKIIKTSDGKDVYLDKNGKIVDKSGLPVKENLFKDLNGESISDGFKVGKERLTTKTGQEISLNGKPVFKSSDGSLIDEDGNKILSKEGKTLFVNENGEVIDSDGNLVPAGMFEVSEQTKLTTAVSKDGNTIIKKDGGVVKFNGKPISQDSNGFLVDSNGEPILSENGSKLRIDGNGRIIDENGNPVNDDRFSIEKIAPIDSVSTKSKEKLVTKNGKEIKYKGENVYKNKDGSLVDSNGNPIRSSDGRPVFMNDDNELVDIEGNIISEDLLTSQSEGVTSENLTSIPASEIKRIGDTDVFVTRDGTLIDKNGRAFSYNGKGVKVGKNGQLFDENGNPVTDRKGKPVYINSKGEMVDSSGKTIDDSILTDGNGVLIDSKGVAVTNSIKRVGDSDIYKSNDGSLVDSTGKTLNFNGESAYVGDDGRLYYQNGKPVTDQKGNSVYLDQATGSLVDRNGNKVDSNILSNKEGTLIDSSGQLVTSGGKLEKIPGTEFYKTSNGQIVDSSGKPVKVNGDVAFVDENGKINDKHGKSIRFKGQDIFLSPDGGIVDRNGQAMLDSDQRAIHLSESGFVNEDGVSVSGNATGQGQIPTNTGFKKTVNSATENVAPPVSQDNSTQSSPVPSDQANASPEKGKPPAAATDGGGAIRLDQASAERLQRRYAMIKTAMRNQFIEAQGSVERDLGLGYVAVGGTGTSGIALEETTAKNGKELEAEGKSQSVGGNKGPVYKKGGTMLYAVNAYQINSDYIKEIVVDIVGLDPKHPLNNAKAMGKFELAYDAMVLTFDKVCPEKGPCVPMKGVALDPATSSAGMASDVDHHLWYRFGGLFISSLLQGTAEAMSESGTREETTSPTGTRVTTSGLDGDKLVLRSFGKVGERFSEAFADRVNRPPTAWINPGEEMAIMLFDDIYGPAEQNEPQ